MRKIINDWVKASLSPEGNQIKTWWNIYQSRESQISMAFLDIDAQVTCLSGLWEEGSAQKQLMGFGHSTQ